MRTPLIAARWHKIVLVTFQVPGELLTPHLPDGVELDIPPGEQSPLASIVALRFAGLRVHGLPVPGATRFAEVNLRFYVRRGDQHGAVFIRELVSNRLVKLGARLLSSEPYALGRVAHEVARVDGTVVVTTEVEMSGRRGRMQVTVDDDPRLPARDSLDHWLKERYWGFSRGRDGATRRYRVRHPLWRTYPVREATIAIDPGLFVDGAWRELDWRERRHSVVVAEGSPSSIDRIERLS